MNSQKVSIRLLDLIGGPFLFLFAFWNNRGKEPKAQPSPAPVLGEAHNIQQRTEKNQSGFQGWRDWIVWTFRIERYDAEGNRLPPVPVEMRGYSFEGFINEGDQVELPHQETKKWQPGQLVKVTSVQNITTGATFKVTKK